MIAHRRTSRAFTLLEVLLAMALVAVVTASLYVSLFVAFRARRSATERLDMVRTARLTMDAIGRDLLAALPPTGVLVQPFSGQDGSAPGGIDADTVSFYCDGPAGAAPGGKGDVREVTFSLIPETNLVITVPGPPGTPESPGIRVYPPNAVPGRLALVRQVRTNLLAPVQEDPVQNVLCRNVVAFNVRYLNNSVWADSWDSSANNNTLPNAIEVTLEIAPTDSSESPDNAEPPRSSSVAKTSNRTAGQSYRLVRLFVPPCAPTTASGSANLGTLP